MFKKMSGLLIVFTSLLLGASVKAETDYMVKWRTSLEIPFQYSSYIITGDHGVILEGKQKGIEKGGSVNYALVTNGYWSDRLISYQKVYGDSSFKIKLKAPKGTKCKIRIYVYHDGYGSGLIKAKPY